MLSMYKQRTLKYAKGIMKGNFCLLLKEENAVLVPFN